MKMNRNNSAFYRPSVGETNEILILGYLLCGKQV